MLPSLQNVSCVLVFVKFYLVLLRAHLSRARLYGESNEIGLQQKKIAGAETPWVQAHQRFHHQEVVMDTVGYFNTFKSIQQE
jgi:hypothetical protein